MLKLFFYLHLAGLGLLAVGAYLLFGVENTTRGVNGVLSVAIFFGLGLLLIAPYPVIKTISWMQNDRR